MSGQTRYRPPAIDPAWLTHEVLVHYPGHRDSKQLIETLVIEYLRLWRLILSYPKKRIVGTGPIIAVQRVHWVQNRQYFNDCMEYFNRYLFMEMVWGGRLDVQGTLDTVRSYRELYKDELPEAWNDITHEYNLGRGHLSIV